MTLYSREATRARMIYATQREHVSDGFVWLKESDLPSRCIVRIKNPATRKVVYCEALQIEENFLRGYNKPPRRSIGPSEMDRALVMGRWFRWRLGDLKTKTEYLLQIESCNGWWGKFRACTHHPQVVVRVAVWLGMVSVALGIVSVVLSVKGLSSSWFGGS